MIAGHVDAAGRALLRLTVRGPLGSTAVEAVVDTGSTGALTLPPEVIARLGLPYFGPALARLADGRVTHTRTYVAEVEWVGGPRSCIADAAGLDVALVGTTLLDGRVLTIDFGETRSVEVR